jgi:N-acetylmuramoyl-L-alanine amidase
MKKFLFFASVVLAAFTVASVLKPSASLAKTVPQVKSFRVVIDAGHGGVDKGVAAENVVEKDVTLLMAQKLKTELEQQNIQVVMTRVGDEFLPLPDRVRIAEGAKPDYFVSFHSREPGRFASPYALSYNSASSKALASALNNQIRHELAVKDVDDKDAVQQRNFYVLREVSAPAVMVSGDLNAFADAESQDKFVHAIMTGLLSLSETEAKN